MIREVGDQLASLGAVVVVVASSTINSEHVLTDARRRRRLPGQDTLDPPISYSPPASNPVRRNNQFAQRSMTGGAGGETGYSLGHFPLVLVSGIPPSFHYHRNDSLPRPAEF